MRAHGARYDMIAGQSQSQRVDVGIDPYNLAQAIMTGRETRPLRDTSSVYIVGEAFRLPLASRTCEGGWLRQSRRRGEPHQDCAKHIITGRCGHRPLQLAAGDHNGTGNPSPTTCRRQS